MSTSFAQAPAPAQSASPQLEDSPPRQKRERPQSQIALNFSSLLDNAFHLTEEVDKLASSVNRRQASVQISALELQALNLKLKMLEAEKTRLKVEPEGEAEAEEEPQPTHSEESETLTKYIYHSSHKEKEELAALEKAEVVVAESHAKPAFQFPVRRRKLRLEELEDGYEEGDEDEQEQETGADQKK